MSGPNNLHLEAQRPKNKLPLTLDIPLQLNVIPELLEPCEGCYPTSLTNGLAIDLLEVNPFNTIFVQS